MTSSLWEKECEDANNDGSSTHDQEGKEVAGVAGRVQVRYRGGQQRPEPCQGGAHTYEISSLLSSKIFYFYIFEICGTNIFLWVRHFKHSFKDVSLNFVLTNINDIDLGDIRLINRSIRCYKTRNCNF